MMISMETVLLRGKRRLDGWLEWPWFRAFGRGMAYLGGGFLLSGAAVWGRMMPIAMGFVTGSPGWMRFCAAVGSAAGYRVFWGAEGNAGAVWALTGLVVALAIPLIGQKQAAGTAALAVLSLGLLWKYRWNDDASTALLLLRAVTAAGCTLLACQRNRLAQWCLGGAGVLALSNVPSSVPLGGMAAGVFAVSAPLPAAALVGLAADIGKTGAVSMAAMACTVWFFRFLPIPEGIRRALSPGAACLLLMVLTRNGDIRLLLAVAVGGFVGAAIPWSVAGVPRRSTGTAQVQLEQTARVLGFFQRQLLEYAPPPLDEGLLLEQLRQSACGTCPACKDCQERERLSVAVLDGDESFTCRSGGKMSFQLRQFRDRLKRMKLARAQQQEYRTAVVQQYGFLADTLRQLADRLPHRSGQPQAKYRVQVSSRSRGKGRTEGDRVLAFPGSECRFYVVLCDGMGTGLGAAEEGRQAAELMKEMLTAGIPPAGALGGLNSQLTLLGRAGAVTVDLAEIRLDSGTIWLYKWGAGPSWLLHRGKARQIGKATPPPGLDMSRFRENTGHVSLTGREMLVMASDGIGALHAPDWAAEAENAPPGALAERILQDGSREDDATAVVIRLVPLSEGGRESKCC